MIYEYTIGPIALVMEIFYSTLEGMVGSYGLAIILLAIVIRIALSPVEKWASRISAQEAEIAGVLTPQLKELKKQYRKAELHEATQRLYRRYGYQPIFAVRSLLGLLVQLPFLIAVFYMLTDLQALEQVPFWIIPDLSRPDGLLGGLNLLPFAMLVVSSAAALATPDFDRRNRLQSIFVSVLFFVLLYASPSGLILYWTTSNVYTLLKTLLPTHQITSAIKRFCAEQNGSSEISRPSVMATYFSIKLRTFRPLDFAKENAFSLSLTLVMLLTLLLLNETITFYLEIPSSDKPNFGTSYFALGTLLVTIVHQIKNNGLSPLKLVPYYLLPIALMGYALIMRNNWTLFGAVLSVLISIPLSVLITHPKRNNNSKDFLALSFLAGAVGYSFYVLYNMDIFTTVTLVKFALFAIGFTLLLACIALPFVRSIHSSQVISVMGAAWILAFFFKFPAYYYMHGSQFEVFALAFATCWATLSVATFKGINLIYVILTMFLICPFFLSGENERLFADDLRHSASLEASILERLEPMPTHPLTDLPNIYFIGAESVSNLEFLQHLGLDKEVAELRSLFDRHGLKTYANALSLGQNTLLSTASTFNLERKSRHHRSVVGGLSLANLWLQRMGYETTIIIQQDLTNGYNRYDNQPIIFDGDLATSRLKTVLKSLASGRIKDVELGASGQSLEKAFQTYILGKKTSPQFVFFHGKYPGHSRMTGICRHNEIELYAERLRNSLVYLKEHIEAIRKNDPNAIIIVSGDHGPYVLEKCTGVPGIDRFSKPVMGDRFGTILSIYWPNTSRAKTYDQKLWLRQNIFPTLFSYLYDSTGPLSLRVDPEMLIENELIWENGEYIGPNKGSSGSSVLLTK